MFEADKGQAAHLQGQGLSIGIVQARFNEGVTQALAAACIADSSNISEFIETSHDSFEIPTGSATSTPS